MDNRKSFMPTWRGALLGLGAATVLATGMPATAQDTMAEQRIRKMEAEIRALQRRVFPGGDQRFFEPEISGSAQPATGPGTAATTAVTDILARLDALEAQLATLTGQIETNTNRIAQLEAAASAPVVTTSAPPGQMTTTDAPTQALPPTPSASQSNLDTMSGGASAVPAAAETPAATPAAPTSARVAAVRAVEKPQTGDAADDEYSYGFRLWDAKLYPEAQQQLKLFLDQHPGHFRTSWARNLLGRSYLDEGNPREAAKWFLQNYQSDKQGGRAPDSLLYLAAAMKEMDDAKRGCIALAEFSETYASEAAGRLSSLYAETRRGLDCAG